MKKKKSGAENQKAIKQILYDEKKTQGSNAKVLYKTWYR